MFKKLTSTVSLFLGFGLLCINLYGLSQTLRPEGLTPDVLRFKSNDVKLSTTDFQSQTQRLPEESDKDFVNRLTMVIGAGLAHLNWESYEPDLYHQRVPLWENYILYFMGTFTSIPEYERYHFANPAKSIERGIGICGDASMIMSQLLDREHIANKIVTIPGHVMVEVEIDSKLMLTDPDFGVALEHGVDYYKNNIAQLISAYNAAGYYNNGELMIANEFIESEYQSWEGVRHFITKKYYFEKFAYFLKWPLPIFLLLLPIFLNKRKRFHGGK